MVRHRLFGTFTAIFIMTLASCGGGGEISSGPAPVVIFEGDDNIVLLATAHELDFGQTYTVLAVIGGYVYACVLAFGLQVAKLNGLADLSLIVTEGLFPDGTGCRVITAVPDKTVFMAG